MALRWIRPRSLKSTILWLFIPVMIGLISVSGYTSYLLASQQVKQNAYINMRDIVAQTSHHLNVQFTTVLTDLMTLSNDKDVLALLERLGDPEYDVEPEDYITINRIVQRIYSSNYSILDSIFLSFNDGKFTFLKSDYVSSLPTFSFDDYYKRFHKGSGNLFWEGFHKRTLFANLEENNKVASVFELVGSPEANIQGIMMFQLRAAFFNSLLNNPQISPNGYLAVVDKDTVSYFKQVAPEYTDDRQLRTLLAQQQEPSGNFVMHTEQGVKLNVVYETLGVNKWRLAAVFPEQDLLQKVSQIKYVSLTVILIVVTCALALSNMLARIVTGPLTRLARKVNRWGEGQLHVEFDIRSDNEIGVLNNGIRDLTGRIGELVRRVEEEENRKRTAELAALQAQIQPHFLYNTLYSIEQLCDLGETEEASRMVSALASFFRISISQGREMIPISEEIEHVRHYLIIQEMRYKDKFRYDIDVDPAVMEGSIVNLTLQPLVENALYHGVKQLRRSGHIRIAGWREGADVLLRVEDNGPGMSSERLEQLRSSLEAKGEGGIGFGFRNVHSRLRLHYGAPYGLTIHSEAGKGTAVTVRIPEAKEPPNYEADHCR